MSEESSVALSGASLHILPADSKAENLSQNLVRPPRACWTKPEVCLSTPEGCHRCQVVEKIFAQNASTKTLQKHHWVRQALQDNWLFNHFQPILHARTGDTFAYEALLRAQNPHTGDVIGAGPLLDACEQMGLQHVLDQQARRTAIYSAAKLQATLTNRLTSGSRSAAASGAAASGAAAIRFFINFLPNTIYDPAICLATTLGAAEESGISMECLVFEVVETERIPDMVRLRRILDYYRQHGVRTAVDDLGSGHASESYLKELQPNYAKIDRELVVRATEEVAAYTHLATLIDRAHDLGIEVVAEGIETFPQRDLCISAGADLLQGFLFARPANPPLAVPDTVKPIVKLEG